MTQPFIPYEKLSKKRQREICRAQRGTWGMINPITKRPERFDAYKRHEEKANIAKARRWNDNNDGLSF